MKEGEFTMAIRKYRMTCCHTVVVDRLTVESPVTVMAE
jgi:hypothetical protein